ncbi:MAG: hypothetical protein OHK0039_19900 [Bacteroidia bacterium]
MSQARLLRQLYRLPPRDQRAFLLWVASPFFNQNERLERLATWLVNRSDPTPPDKRDVLAQLYGEAAAAQGEQQVYDHYSALLRLLEEFMAYRTLRGDDATWRLALLQATLEQGDEEAFPRYHRQAAAALDATPYRDARHHYQAYRLSLEADGYFGRQRRRAFDQNLPDVERHLDTFYLASKLQHSCEMLNRNNIINTAYTPQMIDHLRQALESPGNPYREVPVIAIYYRILLTLLEPETPAHYTVLETLLDTHAGQFARHEAYSMYSYALNYCTRQLNRGQQGYLEKIFQLFCSLLARDILIEAGYLAHWHVKNIVTVALRLHRYDWVRDFLDSYRERIEPGQRDNVYAYFLSLYHYEQQQYPEALRQLQKVVFTDVYYDLSARSLILKLYYEAGDYDALDYHSKAFQSYLRRNKQISAAHRRIHRNLIRLTRKLVRARLRSDPADRDLWRERLGAEIAEVREIADLKWLQAQVARL